jgi:hypothetical protein
VTREIEELLKVWTDPATGTKYVVANFTCFQSRSELEDINKILSTLKEIWGDKLKVIVATPVYDGINTAITESKITPEVVEMFREMLDLSSNEIAETYIRGLFNDQEYARQWSHFKSSFSPISGDRIIEENKLVREEYFTLAKQVADKLPVKPVREAAVQEVSFLRKLGGMLVKFGKKTLEIFKKIGMKFIEVHSKFKDKLKKHSNVKMLLRLVILVSSVAALNALTANGFVLVEGNIRDTIAGSTPLLLVLNGG